MSQKTEIARDLAIDGAKAAPVAAYLAAVANGVDWGAIAAMLAAIYSLILILEKLWRLVVKPLWRRFARGPAS